MWLHDRLEPKINEARARNERIYSEYKDRILGKYQVKHVFNGLRDLDLLISDVSFVDPQEGLKIRGHSITEVLKILPRAKGNEMPLAGGLYYLLLVGDIPTLQDALDVEEEWCRRSDLPYHVADMLRAMPKDTHPMTMFSQAILALQSRSEFSRHYNNDLQKENYWRPMLTDSLSLVAKTPTIAAAIYNIKYHNRELIPPSQKHDWSANFSYMIDKDWDEQYKELSRLFFVIHADQGTGNVSAHSSILVNSALSDIFFSCSAAMNGLAGPLHGRANQDCLAWLLAIRDTYGVNPREEELEAYIWDTLNRGKVIPGYGHPVLRNIDPRFTAQYEFGKKYFADDDLFKLAEMVYKVAPRILTEQGKAKNPWPNIDAISGTLQFHCGMKEYDFYTVLFGVGRVLGLTANLVWLRALSSPLERPQSITTDMLEQMIHETAK
ncbi:MAG TPA: citrate (Si)-synthase [Pelolinea sp.]|nr:citrate (Si)-synthase [Pelolinea sp.]